MSSLIPLTSEDGMGTSPATRHVHRLAARHRARSNGYDGFVWPHRDGFSWLHPAMG
jgi:hypothetical protein